MMQRVEIMVPRRRAYHGDAGFDVFGDGGTGTVDFSAALNDRRVRMWGAEAVLRGHLRDGHLMLRHVDGVDRDGHLAGAHLNDDHLEPAGLVRVQVGRYYFGRFRHAVKVYDGVGNASGATAGEVETVINSWPDEGFDLAASSYSAGSDQMTFSFSPSPQLSA
jgi:hypothetical protein